MSKRDALRELSRRFPPPPEAKVLVESLPRLSDINLIIVGTSLIESVLERLIIKKLPVFNPELEGRLFKGRGPLSDFESKIQIGRALGAMADGLADKLDTIRAIRNAFAHARVPVTFATKEVVEEIDRKLRPWIIKAYEVIHEKPAKADLGGKDVVVSTIRLILFFLDESHEEVAGARLLSP